MDFYHDYYRDLFKPPQKHSTGGLEQTKPGTIGVSSSSATDLNTGPVTTEGQAGEDDGRRGTQARTQSAEVSNKGKAVGAEKPAAAPTGPPPPPPPPPAGHPRKEVLNVEGLDGLLCELLGACEERIQRIRTQCGEGVDGLVGLSHIIQ